jgi:hypothetical protein
MIRPYLLRGGLFPRPPPEGLPVVLGAFVGFDIAISFFDCISVAPLLKNAFVRYMRKN